MKNSIFAIAAIAAVSLFSSCEKDEGKNPNISFKTGAAYVSGDATLAKDSMVVIGISASKAEDKDVLKNFAITRSVNGGADSTIFKADLSGSDADNYNHDENIKIGASRVAKSGDKEKYTCTVINRDGLTGAVSLTVTIK